MYSVQQGRPFHQFPSLCTLNSKNKPQSTLNNWRSIHIQPHFNGATNQLQEFAGDINIYCQGQLGVRIVHVLTSPEGRPCTALCLNMFSMVVRGGERVRRPLLVLSFCIYIFCYCPYIRMYIVDICVLNLRPFFVLSH